MASLSESLTTKLPPVKFHCRQDKTRPKKPPPPPPDDQDGAGVTGKVLRAPDVTASPVIVDFRRLLQSSKSCIDVVPGVPNRDLLHAVVALYDGSLPDVGEEFLYATVCAKWSKTILMLRDSGEVVEELCKSHPVGGTSATSSTQDSGIADGEKGQQGGRGADEKKEDEDKRRFADVFSDSDSSDGSSSDSEEEEDFSAGADDFVQRVRERRQQRRDGRFQPSQGNLGIESRLLACATFERSYCKGEKVVQLHLIAVRRRYRKWGMGRYLLKQVKHPPVVGTYDYLIVHADSSATDFFERFGFSDDVVLNSRFNEFDEQWTNTTMMCYIPPYAGLNGMSSDPELDLKAMELEIRKLREKSLDAYQCQMTCVMRIMHEIVTLQAKLSAQGDIIHTLQDKNDQLQMDKVAQDKRFLDYKLGVMRNMYGSKQESDANLSKDIDEDTSGLNTLVSALEEELEKIQQAKDAGLTVGSQEDKTVSRVWMADAIEQAISDINRQISTLKTTVWLVSQTPPSSHDPSHVIDDLQQLVTSNQMFLNNLEEAAQQRHLFPAVPPQEQLTAQQRHLSSAVPCHEQLTAQQRHLSSAVPPHEQMTAQQRRLSPAVPSHEQLTAQQRHLSSAVPSHEQLTAQQRHLSPAVPPHEQLTVQQRHLSPAVLPPVPGSKPLTQLTSNNEIRGTSIFPLEQLISNSMNARIPAKGTEDFLSQLAHTAEWWQVADDFRRGMKKDSDIEGIVEVTNITPAELTASAVESFHTWRQKLQDPSLCMKLYFCGGLEHPTSRMKELIKYGFSEQDFSHGTFGVGLYFSKHPSKAANFCPLGKILLAEVVLGKTESVVKKNHTRRTPPNGYDSVVTPGRLLPSASGDSMVTNQEYLVFHPDQAIPVCLIEYKIVGQSATNGQSK
ncbi:uncharacterized protein LOC118432312 isoform X1 [Branchiostoma floridae]|uniref:Uncharacterized protein LOC118432312 isoform X1 n=1 Tax=Branchiostoma floridae TaxID=7739 RepID=A0A9J7MEK7_BRAFL|nr:uncharacterized protein LOC118432312 isoform X1 [Branchiostoma floridae]